MCDDIRTTLRIRLHTVAQHDIINSKCTTLHYILYFYAYRVITLRAGNNEWPTAVDRTRSHPVFDYVLILLLLLLFGVRKHLNVLINVDIELPRLLRVAKEHTGASRGGGRYTIWSRNSVENSARNLTVNFVP